MERQRRGGVFGPLLLITVGVIFLLNNTGALGWDIWAELYRLWPILLIAAGLDILIGRRSAFGSLIVGLILAGLLAGGVWWVSTQAGGGDLRTYAIAQPQDGAHSAGIEIAAGAGALNVGPLPEGDLLVAGTVILPERLRLHQRFDNIEGRARYEIRSSTANTGFPGGGRGGENWQLDLNRDLPLDLRISTGVGKSMLDLERLTLTEFDLNMGIGDVTLILPRRGDLAVTIDGGIGTVDVILPRGMAARINADAGIGRVKVRGDFERRGDVWVSPEFESAADRLDINIDGGIGNIDVETGTGE